MKPSCGILPFRVKNGVLEVFIVHPGGPFFKFKNKGYWGLCKGELNPNEEHIDCAIREFKEETGVDFTLQKDKLIDLGSIIQKNKKQVYAWAIHYQEDIVPISNTFKVKLGFKTYEFPEIDKGEFFTKDKAIEMIREDQRELIKRVERVN